MDYNLEKQRKSSTASLTDFMWDNFSWGLWAHTVLHLPFQRVSFGSKSKRKGEKNPLVVYVVRIQVITVVILFRVRMKKSWYIWEMEGCQAVKLSAGTLPSNFIFAISSASFDILFRLPPNLKNLGITHTKYAMNDLPAVFCCSVDFLQCIKNKNRVSEENWCACYSQPKGPIKAIRHFDTLLNVPCPNVPARLIVLLLVPRFFQIQLTSIT